MSLADIQIDNKQKLYGTWINTLPIVASTGNIISGANENISIGTDSGNTSQTGTDNICIGYANGTVLTSGSQNVLIGSFAGASLTTGSRNVLVGYTTGNLGTTASDNVFIGQSAGTGCRGNTNVGIGAGSLQGSGNNDQCVSIGFQAMSNAQSATRTVAIGYQALVGVTTGGCDSNIAIGRTVMPNYTGGGLGNNICIGNSTASTYTGTETNNIVIGNSVAGQIGDLGTVRIGSNTHTKLFIPAAYKPITGTTNPLYVNSSGQIGLAVSSGKYKTNLTPIHHSEKIHKLVPIEYDCTFNGHTVHEVGLLAEHTHKIMPELCNYNTKGEVSGIRYHDLIPHMIREIQQMKKSLDGVDNDEENFKEMFEIYAEVRKEVEKEKEIEAYNAMDDEGKSVVDHKKYLEREKQKYPKGLV